MRKFLFVLSVLFLSACSEYYTVEEFDNDETLRQTFLQKCNANLLRRDDPICVNARASGESHRKQLDAAMTTMFTSAERIINCTSQAVSLNNCPFYTEVDKNQYIPGGVNLRGKQPDNNGVISIISTLAGKASGSIAGSNIIIALKPDFQSQKWEWYCWSNSELIRSIKPQPVLKSGCKWIE